MPCNGAQSAVINWHVTQSRRFVAFAVNWTAVHERLPLTQIEMQSGAQIHITNGCAFFSRFKKTFNNTDNDSLKLTFTVYNQVKSRSVNLLIKKVLLIAHGQRHSPGQILQKKY